MLQKTDKIWMDGKLVPWDKATVHIMTHTLHYGLGAFEGIRCYSTPRGPAVFKLDDHINRLFQSAQIFLLKMPYTKQEIKKAIIETVKVNKVK